MIALDALHDQAMELAEAALFAKRRHDSQTFLHLTRQAYELEHRAADLLQAADAPEPTRSVIHRSAATLALECGEWREAERIIARALAGEPPAEIAEELRDLLDEVNRERHLALARASLTMRRSEPQRHAVLPSGTTAPSPDALPVRVVGRLLMADKQPTASPVIKIVDENTSPAKVHHVIVPPGIMDDIVKPFWGEIVVITGFQSKDTIYLDDIHKDE